MEDRARTPFRDKATFENEPVLLAVPTDITFDGRFERQWLIVTKTDVAAVSDDDPPACSCRVSLGPAEFVIRANHSSVQDFGPTGKLLIDVDDNRFLVQDAEALPRRQQALFRRYVYW
jgi:hypothetical protein